MKVEYCYSSSSSPENTSKNFPKKDFSSLSVDSELIVSSCVSSSGVGLSSIEACIFDSVSVVFVFSFALGISWAPVAIK